MPPENNSLQGNHHPILIGGIVVGALVIGLVFFYLFPKEETAVVPAPEVTTSAPAAQDASLGADIYTKAANPIGDELPAESSPTANPINDAYKNPFE